MSGTSAPPDALIRRSLIAVRAARDVAAVGNWVVLVGLLAWSYAAWESTGALSLLLLGQMLPPFLLGFLADHVVDERNARGVAFLAQLLRAAALVPLLVAFSGVEIPLVFAVAWLSGVPTAFSRAAIHSLLPIGIPTGHRSAVKGALARTDLLALIVGPALGTAIMSAHDLRIAAAVGIVTLLLSAVLLLLVRPQPVQPASARERTVPALADRPKGLVQSFGDPKQRTPALLQVAVAVMTGGLIVPQAGFVVWGLYVDHDKIGLLLAAQGLGIAVGYVARGVLGPRLSPGTLISLGMGAMAAGSFGLALSERINWAMAFTAILGVGGSLPATGLPAFVVEAAWIGSRRSARGGVGLAVEAMVLLSIIVLGPLADVTKPRITLLGVGMLLAVLGLCAYGTDPVPATQVAQSPN